MEGTMKWNSLAAYIAENANDVSDLAKLDTISKSGATSQYGKVLVKELRSKYELSAIEERDIDWFNKVMGE
jgi:hypothetical protein